MRRQKVHVMQFFPDKILPVEQQIPSTFSSYMGLLKEMDLESKLVYCEKSLKQGINHYHLQNNNNNDDSFIYIRMLYNIMEQVKEE